MSNTALWDKLGKTDPAHTKGFKRSGGFSGTAIKPMWAYKRMTEEFGPCGEGWGVSEPSFQVVPGHNGEILVYCTVSIWHGDAGRTVFGVGGDKIVSYIKANEQYNRPERWENDDEAFKKAFTDAVTNALKLIGVGADVHMGMFDDNKYVNSLRNEFADAAKPKPQASKNDRNAVIADTMIEAARLASDKAALKAWKEGQKKEIEALDEVNRKRVTTALTDFWNALSAAENLRAG